MPVTPSDLYRLAVERHRSPWNWTLHLAGTGVFCLALLLHGPLTFATALILFGAGFFRWPEPVRRDTRWLRFVHRAVEWEKDWAAAPWNRYKWPRFILALFTAAVGIWALWTREPAALALLAGFAVLARVAARNREDGIDP